MFSKAILPYGSAEKTIQQGQNNYTDRNKFLQIQNDS